MKRVCVVAIGIFLAWLPTSLAAQTADSAAAYAAIVARQPDNARAIFKLAGLQPRGSARALELYRRYVALEPGDAWGHLALAEALAAARHFREANEHIRRADQLAPDHEDVRVVRQRVQKAQRQAAPTAQPRVAITHDSDQNQLTQLSFAGDVPVDATSRLGAGYTHSSTSDGAYSLYADEGRLTLQTITPTTRFEASGGLARVAAFPTFSTGVGRIRVRYRAGRRGTLVDVRAQRAPLLVSPLLMLNQVLLSEVRGTVELPVAGAWRIRANAQLGDLGSAELDTMTYLLMQNGGMGHGRGGNPMTTTSTLPRVQKHNRRVGYGGALVAHVGAASEISANYYQLSYDAAARSGYFAPRLVQLAEIGSYSEIYQFDPIVLAFDVGAGMQRSAQQHLELGKWEPALRGWGQLTIPLARAVELNLETDYYKSQLSTVSTSGSWSSVMGAVSFRWLIGY